MRPALSDDAEWLARAQLLLDTASVTGSAAPPATDLDPALRAALRDLVEEAVFFTTRSTSVLIKLSHLHQKFDLTEFITSDFVNFFLHGRASKPKNTNHVRKRETAINTNIITNITTNTTTNTTANTRRGRITPVKGSDVDVDIVVMKIKALILLPITGIKPGSLNGDKASRSFAPNPPQEMVWYGVDEEGAVYSGNIVYDENSQGNDKAGSSKTPGQCGERIRALARQRK
ncbi:hypothetical protein ABEF95_012050 [Exophiala dermatitidis]|uniref:Uncharacterized protein n=1 Tax=Exophiala dermatitidis (strain ATCC 34100 / CBS 525.76 / NIH/UT8656) TaxID=858893 RepID=H6CAX1_EXODN|nr:uncharacterized protein HMPREF1120_08861 [Exophiala dermatitidis NIH/UT8656]EHY60918.1 hypothetical protein HMPREF1120_08861 [Exophiala dermatitidis NIH/UT8656]